MTTPIRGTKLGLLERHSPLIFQLPVDWEKKVTISRSPWHNHTPSTEFGRSSTGKAKYQAENKDLSFSMWDSYWTLPSPPFYLLSLLLCAAPPPSSAKWAPWLLFLPWFNWSNPADRCIPSPKTWCWEPPPALPSALSSVKLPGWCRQRLLSANWGEHALSIVSPPAKSRWPAVRQINFL